MNTKTLLSIIVPSVISLLSGCEIYGARQFNPNIAANDINTPLPEQFKSYFYSLHVSDFLNKGGNNTDEYRFYPEETTSYSEIKVFNTGNMQSIDLDLWSSIAKDRCKAYNGKIFNRSSDTNSFNMICIQSSLPVFYIKINEGYNDKIYTKQNRKGSSGVWANAAETSNINDSNWLEKAKDEGWTPNFEEKERIIKQNQIAEQKRKQKAIQELYSKVKSSQIGTMVCKNGKNAGFETLSVGYIEDKKDNRLKISIVRKFYPTLNSIDAGFSPVTIWDNYQNWYVCNYDIE